MHGPDIPVSATVSSAKEGGRNIWGGLRESPPSSCHAKRGVIDDPGAPIAAVAAAAAEYPPVDLREGTSSVKLVVQAVLLWLKLAKELE
mmetsp:Transcript_73922/g.175936  ORF Transcript_73922/g.175936 Transcript_73922/m.175936 type:complete len:89 (-) Transcript_73922:1292-1558(-)